MASSQPQSLLTILQRREVGIETLETYSQKCVGAKQASLLNSGQQRTLIESCLPAVAVVTSRDGTRIATTHGDHTVRVYDAMTKQLIEVIAEHDHTPWCVQFHPQNSNIVCSASVSRRGPPPQVIIFDISLGKVVTRVQVPGARKILALDWHPSGEVIAFSAENSLIFWKWDSSRDYHTIGIRLHDQDTHIFHRMNFVQTVRCFKFDLGGAMAFLGLYDDASDLQEYGLGICTVNQGTTLHYCRFSLNSILRKLDTGGHSYIESPVCNNFLEKLQARDNRWFKDRRGGNPNTEMSTLSFPIDLLLAMELYLTNVTEGQELEYCDSFAHHEEEFTKIATEAAKSLIEEQDAQSELPNLGTQEKQQLLTFYINLLLRSYRQAREEYCGFVTTHSDRLLSGWEAERFCARFIKLSAHHNSASDNYSHAEAIFTKIMKPVDIISNPRKYSVHGYGTLETTESRKESSPSETFRQAFCQRHRYLLAVPPCNVVKDYQDSCLEGSVHLSTNAAIYGNGSIDSTSTYKGTIAYPCYHDSTRSLAQEVGLFPPSQTYISSQLLIVDSGINLAVEWIREQYRKAVGDYICSNSIDPPQRNCFNDLNDDLLPSIIRIDDGRRICEQQLTKSLSSNIRVNIEEGAPRDVACNRGTKRKLSPEEPGSSKKRGISNSKEVHSITYIGHVVVYQSFSYGSIMRILSFGSMHPFEITCIKLSPCEEYIFVGFERQSTPIVGDVIDGIVLRINDGVLCRKVFNDSTDKGSINMATFCSVPGNLLTDARIGQQTKHGFNFESIKRKGRKVSKQLSLESSIIILLS